jgi:hypothetical protein
MEQPSGERIRSKLDNSVLRIRRSSQEIVAFPPAWDIVGKDLSLCIGNEYDGSVPPVPDRNRAMQIDSSAVELSR